MFFREVQLTDKDEAVGAQGVPLTPGRSIAVDKSLHVYGTPFFIEGELPIEFDAIEDAVPAADGGAGHRLGDHRDRRAPISISAPVSKRARSSGRLRHKCVSSSWCRTASIR